MMMDDGFSTGNIVCNAWATGLADEIPAGRADPVLWAFYLYSGHCRRLYYSAFRLFSWLSLFLVHLDIFKPVGESFKNSN